MSHTIEEAKVRVKRGKQRDTEGRETWRKECGGGGGNGGREEGRK